MLTNLAIWYLKLRKRTVVMNCQIHGKSITAKHKSIHLINVDMEDN